MTVEWCIHSYTHKGFRLVNPGKRERNMCRSALNVAVLSKKLPPSMRMGSKKTW
jgi:hypothetical protein